MPEKKGRYGRKKNGSWYHQCGRCHDQWWYGEPKCMESENRELYGPNHGSKKNGSWCQRS